MIKINKLKYPLRNKPDNSTIRYLTIENNYLTLPYLIPNLMIKIKD